MRLRLTDVLLATAAALVLAMDASSASSGVTLSKPNMVLPRADGGVRSNQRFLRAHYADDGEDEERGFKEWLASQKILLRLARADNDDKARIISEVRDPDLLAALFKQTKSHLHDAFPSFKDGMHANDFTEMVQRSKLDSEAQGMLISAYSKYWSTNQHLKPPSR
uniref:RxLR effector protein n=1 Tax=Phytophthora sojae TaxID=67593 RepID=G1FR81_PHYSO|nr:Avh78 [Phytophthora sojae]AEK80619.1 Avh78 [Phytophthora sojae]